MVQKIELDGKLYDLENLSDQEKDMVALLQYSNSRVQELTNMQALLQRAKNSYVESLKKEMLSGKSGFLFGDD